MKDLLCVKLVKNVLNANPVGNVIRRFTGVLNTVTRTLVEVSLGESNKHRKE